MARIDPRANLKGLRMYFDSNLKLLWELKASIDATHAALRETLPNFDPAYKRHFQAALKSGSSGPNPTALAQLARSLDQFEQDFGGLFQEK